MLFRSGCKHMRDGVVPLVMMADNIIFKGYDKDSVRKILNAHPLPETELTAAIEEFRKENGTKHSKRGVRHVVN